VAGLLVVGKGPPCVRDTPVGLQPGKADAGQGGECPAFLDPVPGFLGEGERVRGVVEREVETPGGVADVGEGDLGNDLGAAGAEPAGHYTPNINNRRAVTYGPASSSGCYTRMLSIAGIWGRGSYQSGPGTTYSDYLYGY
jgi:hypothetical protein